MCAVCVYVVCAVCVVCVVCVCCVCCRCCVCCVLCVLCVVCCVCVLVFVVCVVSDEPRRISHAYVRFVPLQSPRRISDVGRGIPLWPALNSSPVVGPHFSCCRRHSRRLRPTHPSAKFFFVFIDRCVRLKCNALHLRYISHQLNFVTCS